MGDLSKELLPTAIAWNCSGFACMQLKWNQFMSILLSFYKTLWFIQLCRRQHPFFSFSKFWRGSNCFATRK
jgi:cytochrome b subunit of formate dehydrogenase